MGDEFSVFLREDCQRTDLESHKEFGYHWQNASIIVNEEVVVWCCYESLQPICYFQFFGAIPNIECLYVLDV